MKSKNKNSLRKGSFFITTLWRTLAGVTFLLASSNLMVSCFAEEEAEGFGDIFIVTELVGQDTLKGLNLHAFSYSEFASVTVTPPNGTTTYTLSPYMGYKQDYVWAMPVSQFSKTLPAAGSYVFNATFANGQSKVFSDNLTTDYILPPVIKVCQFVVSTERVDVEWNSVSKAHVYNVKLLNMSDSVLFISDVYNNTITNYSFELNSDGWQSPNYPTTGQSVKVEVDAYLLESSSSLDNLQAVSRSRKTITWGNQN